MSRISKHRRAIVAAVAVAVLAACGSEEPDADSTDPSDEPGDETAAADDEASDSDSSSEWAFDTDLSGTELDLMIHPAFYDGSLGGAGGLLDEFEEHTGAVVNVITAPTGDSYTRQMVEFQQGTSSFDVIFPIYTDMHPQYREHLHTLDTYIENAPEEFDYDDLIPTLQEQFEYPEGIKALTFRWGVEFYFYRPSLFEEAGIEPPTSFDEIDSTARAVHEATGRFGWSHRGLGHELVQDWLSLYAANGGTLYDEVGENEYVCAVDTPEAVEVLDMVSAWQADGIIPQDFMAEQRDDTVTYMQQDRTAQGFFFGPRYNRFVDGDSDVADDVAWLDTHPGELSRNGTQTVAITEYSENKDAAWALIEWILHPDHTSRFVTDWGGSVVRMSDLEDSEVLEAYPIAEDEIAATENSYMEPAHLESNRIFDIMNEELSAAILGDKPSSQALSDACGRIDQVLT